jgi:hypothetical protein
MYSAVFEEVAVTAAQDLFEIVAPADSVVIIHGFEISQSSDTDSEGLNLLVHRGSTSGSGGSTPTPAPMNVGDAAFGGTDAAFGGTVEANNTSQSTEGTQLHAAAFNVLSGYAWIPTPETRPVLSPSGRIIIELQTAPADSLTMSGTVYFEEIGG